jgi:hypothetical protein
MPNFSPEWMKEHRFEHAKWASDGEVLWVPCLWPDGVWYLVPAKAACAAGNLVRVVNKDRILDRWYDVYRRLPKEVK